MNLSELDRRILCALGGGDKPKKARDLLQALNPPGNKLVMRRDVNQRLYGRSLCDLVSKVDGAFWSLTHEGRSVADTLAKPNQGQEEPGWDEAAPPPSPTPSHSISLRLVIPVKICREMQDQIYEAYDGAVDEMQGDDEEYVAAKIERVLGRLREHGDWLDELASTADALYVTYFLEPDKETRLKDEGRRCILAALSYLCNPFDVIPDYDPHKGYADDALVMNRCVALLRSQWTFLYQDAGRFRMRGHDEVKIA